MYTVLYTHSMLDELIKTQLLMVGELRDEFKRYLYPHIDWGVRAMALVGARGTGKTTLLLQHYLSEYNDPERCLYVLGDDLALVHGNLRIIANDFVAGGGEVLMIDEVHKYPNWSQEIKNIYDTLPQLKLVISGSASLNILEAKHDLSRRVVTYNLKGLSFREFVNIETNSQFEVIKLDELLDNHVRLARIITKKLKAKNHSILRLFANYLKYGYYPFYLEGIKHYRVKLENTFDKILYEDIPAVFGVKPSSIQVLRKMIHLVGSSSPYKIDIQRTAGSIGVSRITIYSYLEYLIRAQLLYGIKASSGGTKSVRKPEKLYLSNPNLYQLISNSGNKGAIRECFAINQLSPGNKLLSAKKGDFLVNEKYTFEVGGKTKSREQIKKIAHSFVLNDGVEVGYQNRIPLYLLGFLY